MPRRSRFFRYENGEIVEVQRSVAGGLPQYPIACETLAVHPDQISEAREFDRTHGVPTDYRSDGSPIMKDSRHYKRYRRLHGYHFRNGFES
jgi:hypothetical protein